MRTELGLDWLAHRPDLEVAENHRVELFHHLAGAEGSERAAPLAGRARGVLRSKGGKVSPAVELRLEVAVLGKELELELELALEL